MLRRLCPAALAILTIGAATAMPVRGEETQCQRGDLIRRVELQFADDADRLPCEVIYWKDTETPGRPQLLWKAEFNTEFCVDKAEALVERLAGAGWRCDDNPELATAVADPSAATRAPTRPAVEAGPATGPTRKTTSGAADASSGKVAAETPSTTAAEVAKPIPLAPSPTETEAIEAGTAGTEAVESETAALDVGTASTRTGAGSARPETAEPKPTPSMVADAAILDQGLTIEPGAGPRPAPTPSGGAPTILAAAVARDVQRLDQLTAATPGGFEVDMAMIGDLDQDEIDDAAVLMSYQADGVRLEHHLLAYLFDGQTFRPVARINLATSDARVGGAEIRNVVDGVIQVELAVFQPTDPPCCPSRRQNVDYKLREGRLVNLTKEPGA